MENIASPDFLVASYETQKPYGSIFVFFRQRLITDKVVLCILEQLPYSLSISISVITAWFII
jgi:hypothetical protein